MIKPIIKSNSIVNLPVSEIFENKNNNIMFGIRDQCKNFFSIKICNRNKLEDLSEDSCLPKLLKGEQATCGFTNADHIPNLEEIDDGIILVNNFNGNVTGKDNAKKIQGTFLISFWNEDITEDLSKITPSSLQKNVRKKINFA